MEPTLRRPAKCPQLVSQYLTGKKHILLADESQSSPFDQKQELLDLLTRNFPDYTIVRLSQIKLEDFRDFVCLYDVAQALVTIETSFLHLSAFSIIPTFVLATDRPETWHGSLDQKRFKFYCRYSEWEKKKEDLIQALRDELDNRSKPVLEIHRTTHSFAYNPSLIEYQGERLISYRYHPNPNQWRSELVLDGNTIKMPEAQANDSCEDARLFIFKDKLYMSYTVGRFSMAGGQITPCVIGYGQLEDSDGWKLVNHIQPKLGKNDFTSQEKNWVFYVHDNALHVIYSLFPEHAVYQLDGERVVREYKTKLPGWKWGQPRGGTQPLQYRGLWLRFFHSQVPPNVPNGLSRYYMGALLMEPKPPFQITAISSRPVLEGREAPYYYGWRYYKPNVMIPYGAVPAGDGWDVAVGVNDSACAIAHIKPEHLNL